MTHQLIPIVNNTLCTMPGEDGPKCYHFSSCNNVTRDCGCEVTYVAFSLCTQPVFNEPGALHDAFFYGYKVVPFVLQGLVLACSVVVTC